MIGTMGPGGPLDIIGALSGKPTPDFFGALVSQYGRGGGGGALSSKISPQQIQALLAGIQQAGGLLGGDSGPQPMLDQPNLGPVGPIGPVGPSNASGPYAAQGDALGQLLQMLRTRGIFLSDADPMNPSGPAPGGPAPRPPIVPPGRGYG